MTISSENRKAGPFTGNGSTTSFPFTFKVFTKSDLQVVRRDANGVEHVLVLDSDYSVTLNADQDNDPGGAVTFPLSGSALPSTQTLTIAGALDYLQPADITNQGGFYPQVVEDALDRAVILTQQLKTLLNGALQLPISTPAGVSTQLPVPEANKIIAWNQAANALQNLDTTELATLVAYGTAKGDIFTGDGATTQFTLTSNPGALNNLDVSVGGITQLPNVDYSWNGGTLVTFASAPPSGEKVFVRYMQGLPFGTVQGADVVNGTVWSDVPILSFDATGLIDKTLVYFADRDTVGDGGGGPLRFLAGSTAPANGITVYAVNGGRLVREGWTVFGVNVKWAGAKTGDDVDVTANTTAIQAAIDLSPFNLFFPEGTYLVNSLQYYWGDTGSQATRVWHGPGAIIKGAADSAPYLVDFSGQKLRVRDIEFQGKGEFDDDYECIWRFHTRNNTVNVNDLHFDGATARFNGKAIIYSLPTDTTALVSEVFFNGVTVKQVQRGVDVQGSGMVDSLWNACYLTTSALPAPGNLDENYLFKINRGSHNLVGCEVMQTDLNAGQIPGWTVLFPSTANKATWNMTGGILEVKSGFSWKDGADGGVAICNNTNGYWGYVHSDPLFKVGTGCTGGINLSNAKLLHDAANFQTDFGPLIVDSANSPEFRVYIDENTLIAPDDFQALDLMTKIIGGKWSYPESQITMAYGNDVVSVTAGNMSPVDFTTSWVDSAYTTNRLKGIYGNGVITIPQEGLQGAWIEVLVDWDQATSKCYLVRRTSALCSVTNGSDYVQLVDQQNPGNFFPLTYQLGIVPTAKVTGTGATAGMTVSPAFFDSTNFRLSSAWAGSTGNVALTFEMKVGEIAKGELRRYDLGDFRPGDQFFLGLEAVSATTSTTLPYQRMRMVAKSRLNAMKVNGNN